MQCLCCTRLGLAPLSSVDGFKPDVGDLVGSIVAATGVLLCWFWPRANL